MMEKGAKLAKNIVGSKLVLKAARDGFGDGLVLAAGKDGRIVGLCADVSDSTRMSKFKEAFPERYVQLGVHEQLLAAAAAGMALAGKMPFIAAYAVFSPGRSWEQVRTNICINNADVKIVGTHAGVNVGPDGATHQALEDMAIMRTLPNMTVIAPCDAIEAKKATLAMAKRPGPAYLRVGREKTPVITTEETPFRIGRAQVFRQGRHAAIIACGSMVQPALQAAEELSKEGLDCLVLNCHTIKPLDAAAVSAAARRCGAVVTAEEHQVHGGLGSAVAEVLAASCPVPMEFVGVRDVFGESGEAGELLRHFGLTAADIKKAVKKAVARKRQ
jgi:transketolase